jgi:murein DD-endopeptidase MepM/ murein hydrolase activator NlpD
LSARRPPRISARAISYGVVGALAALAVRFTPPIAARAPAARFQAARPAAAPGGPAAASPAGPAWNARTVTRAPGEPLAALLARAGLGAADAREALRATWALGASLPAGTEVEVGGLSTDSAPRQVIFKLAIDRLVQLRRTPDGWQSARVQLPWATDTVSLAVEVNGSLARALAESEGALPAKLRTELAYELADIFEYRIDMSRDLHPGDRVQVLVERATAPSGAVRLGNVLAASFDLAGKRIEAFRYASRGASGGYFDQDGKSLRAQFLRAPLAFRRVSSVFGLRRHPILGVWRAHKGTDYAASLGTPVRSIGDGVVVFAGRRSGYGNVVDVRHRNGYVSRYGHLSRFARSARVGSRVTIGQTIGSVGMSGLATAPHLHFEVLVGGVQRDPRVVLRSRSGEPLAPGERARFDGVRQQLLASLDPAAGATRLAAASAGSRPPATRGAPVD